MKKQKAYLPAYDYRSPSPLMPKLQRTATSQSRSPYRHRETFNPLSPDNIDYLVNKHISDSNSKDHVLNPKSSFESTTISEPFGPRKTYYYGAEPVLQENTYASNKPKENSSKAYVNAMRALQVKIKSLEEENRDLKSSLSEKDHAKEEEVTGLLRDFQEKERMFEGLERNLKEKLGIIEKERNDYERKLFLAQKENENLRNEASDLERKYEEEFASYLSEKAEIKALLKVKEDKLELVERDNQDLKDEIESLRRGKQGIELELLSGSEENKKAVKELKEKVSFLLKENEDGFREWSQKENELTKELELERNEKNSMGKELNELRILNERNESQLTECKFLINQKENELLLLREKVKNLIREKETSSGMQPKILLPEQRPQIVRKTKDLLKISEDVEKDRESLEENKGKGKYSRFLDSQMSQIQRTVPTLGNEEEGQKNQRRKVGGEDGLDKDYQAYTLKSKKKSAKYDLESVVGSIIQLEKELVKYIEKYKFLSSRLAEYENDSNESARIREEMTEMNENIHRINQEIFELKKIEDSLMDK